MQCSGFALNEVKHLQLALHTLIGKWPHRLVFLTSLFQSTRQKREWFSGLSSPRDCMTCSHLSGTLAVWTTAATEPWGWAAIWVEAIAQTWLLLCVSSCCLHFRLGKKSHRQGLYLWPDEWTSPKWYEAWTEKLQRI